MTLASDELLTPNETSFISGVPLKEVYKVARERLPDGLLVRKSGTLLFRPAAAVCVRIDHELPKDVPLKVRKAFYAEVKRDPRLKRLEHKAGQLIYVFDASLVEKAVSGELDAYRKAMRLIREDPDIQAGAAVFADTRILVHTIADQLKAGATADELKEDYPSLTDGMLAAAPIYARSHPKRGRPRVPRWRQADAVSSKRYDAADA